jgi:hypothetical protein
MASPRRNSSKHPRRKLATESDGRERPETRKAIEPVHREAAEIDPYGCVRTLNYRHDGNLLADEESHPSGRRRTRRHAIALSQQQGPTVVQPRNRKRRT